MLIRLSILPVPPGPLPRRNGAPRMVEDPDICMKWQNARKKGDKTSKFPIEFDLSKYHTSLMYALPRVMGCIIALKPPTFFGFPTEHGEKWIEMSKAFFYQNPMVADLWHFVSSFLRPLHQDRNICTLISDILCSLLRLSRGEETKFSAP